MARRTSFGGLVQVFQSPQEFDISAPDVEMGCPGGG